MATRPPHSYSKIGRMRTHMPSDMPASAATPHKSNVSTTWRCDDRCMWDPGVGKRGRGARRTNCLVLPLTIGRIRTVERCLTLCSTGRHLVRSTVTAVAVRSKPTENERNNTPSALQAIRRYVPSTRSFHWGLSFALQACRFPRSRAICFGQIESGSRA